MSIAPSKQVQSLEESFNVFFAKGYFHFQSLFTKKSRCNLAYHTLTQRTPNLMNHWQEFVDLGLW